MEKIRGTIPGVSLGTDVIVGFPGETDEQYQQTVQLVQDLEFDKVHTAAYSSRPGTIADRTMPDDVSQQEKEYRLKNLDQIQERILTDKNSRLMERRWKCWWTAIERANGKAAPETTS